MFDHNDGFGQISTSTLISPGTGAAAGAIAGSIIPGLGTAIGAAIGSLVGAFGSIFGGGGGEAEYQAAVQEILKKREWIRNFYAQIGIDSMTIWSDKQGGNATLYDVMFPIFKKIDQLNASPNDQTAITAFTARLEKIYKQLLAAQKNRPAMTDNYILITLNVLRSLAGWSPVTNLGDISTMIVQGQLYSNIPTVAGQAVFTGQEGVQPYYTQTPQVGGIESLAAGLPTWGWLILGGIALSMFIGGRGISARRRRTNRPKVRRR